ncbi:zinc finger and BTB domain-containing protein 40 isoform X2 [Gymnodraco acuticeps]|nr:zinc finger and BTB domain-containing protein 40 isoform X2 [Gymnodraco acuticeps]
MMELPNYSSQLMQQLWALRREGHLCDCTILVGDSPHRAHKLVLAASSMLFRSLLEGSDTISIDTAMVSSQEFGCLLDMVYTGKLPLGKHNVSRIVAAADSLQMFDVAVGFKNILTSLVNQQTPVHSTHTSSLPVINQVQNMNTDGSASPSKEDTTSDKTERESESEAAEEPACKRSCVQNSEPEEAKPSVVEENNPTAAQQSNRPAAGVLEHSSELVELLSNMPSVLELLSQAAQGGLAEQERQLVCECCEEADPYPALEKLLSLVREEQLSETVLLTLLLTLQQQAPSSFPSPLLPLLEEAQSRLTAGGQLFDSGKQNGSGSEEKREDEDNKEESEEDEKVIDAPTDSSSPSKPYSCRWCKRGFAFKCRMLAHVKRCPSSQEGEQQCPQCPKKLANQRALQQHRAEAHRSTTRLKKKVSCDLCGRNFAHPSGMLYHKRTEHFEEKPFACEDCGAKFGANSSLKNHMRLHTGEKPYCCKHCHMSFSVAAALAYHTKKKHSEDLLEPHDCQKCCLSFSSLEEHRQHIHELHPKEFHKCPTCDKVFTSAALLDKHKGTHTGSKPFSCELCNKSYQQLSGLWYHNRTNHPDMFANHTRQLKTLCQCDVCFKFFPSAASVAKHQAAEHQGSTAAALTCPYCPAVLGGEEELQEHLSSQHLEASSCPFCSLLCCSQLELQEHLLSCHMEAQEEQGGGEEQGGEEEQESSSHTETAAHPAGNEGAESEAQQVFVALAGGGEVNMYELLNSSVTIICEDKAAAADS